MFRYKEDKIIEDIENYVKSTYGQHYVAEAKGSQVIDIWEANGSLQSMRYGKKDGKNKKDLLKAVHYIILMMYVDEKEIV